MPETRFIEGKSYVNRKGAFTVVSITGDRMRIRWKDGKEQESDIAQQEKIMANMAKEEALQPEPPPIPKKPARKRSKVSA